MASTRFTGFQFDTTEPADSRVIAADSTARLGIPSATIYKGLICVQQDTGDLYIYMGDDGTNTSSDWELFSPDSGTDDLTTQTPGANTTLEANVVYVLGASNIDLAMPSNPAIGDRIYIANIDNRTDVTFTRNGNNIMGVAEDMDLDNEHASFTFIWVGGTAGWVIIGPDGGGASVSSGGSSSSEVGTNTLSTSNGTVELYAVNVITSGTSGLNISIPTDIANGDWFEIANLSGETDNNIQRGSFLIQGESTDLLLDDASASFRLTFINATTGWVVTGAN